VRFEVLPEAAISPQAPTLAELERVILPEELCSRITVAAELHSTTVLKTCLEELRALGGSAVPLADHLRHLLRSYDFVAIARLLARLRVQTPIATE
jgi:hypothetical protein